MAPKILIILTSADKIPSSGKTIGWYLPELAHPWDVLHSKAELTFASPLGGEAPVDPASVSGFSQDKSSVSFLNEQKSLYQNTHKLADLVPRASDFDAVFYPGGHGPMFDLVDDADSILIASKLYAEGKPLAAVCHGPVALLNVKDSTQESVLKGRKVSGFSDVEEEQAGFTKDMPFSLEAKLQEKSGGKFEKASEPWGEKVIVDGQIITGQNPASAKGVGEALAKALKI